jgi:hypothetical protein
VGLRAASLFLAAAALLLPSGAPAARDVPGDPTPPVVIPVITGTLGLNGWYTSSVTLNWSITDPESTITSTSGCDAVTFTADTTGVTRTCSATSDGGTTTITKPLKLDKTAPAANAAASRSSDSNGWFNHALNVNFSGSDAMSGLDFCSPTASYGGPDTGNASVSGTCKDKAGNTAGASLILRYDATAPVSVTANPGRQPDANGWYNHDLSVSFSGSDATSGLDFCSPAATYAGPDSAGASVSGVCKDKAGNVAATSVVLKYDETAPVSVAGTPGRLPDANGWYNRPVTVTFRANDATSGVDVCTQTTYRGPDDASAAISGSCRDKAGNGADTSFAFKYDNTAPTIVAANTKLGNRSAQVAWRKSADTSLVEVTRIPGRNGAGESVVYRGSENGFRDNGLAVGRKYEYRIAGFDSAENRTERTIDLVAAGALMSPMPGAKVKAPPILDWIPVKGATYYNLQLVRGRKVLSTWPVQSSFRMRRTWTFNGRRYRLRPGTYRWYVWPGFGRISASRYGRLLGSSSFVVAG